MVRDRVNEAEDKFNDRVKNPNHRISNPMKKRQEQVFELY